MSAQLNIFERNTAPYVRASRTSREAAKAIEPRVGTQKAIVLAAIRNAGANGLTDQEALELTRRDGITDNAIRARRGSLAADGWIEQSGITRTTTSGKQAVVWVAKEWIGK